MKIVHLPAELRKLSAAAARNGKKTGLVPTMGALHAGHQSLIEKALKENDRVIVSIFVNPLQFGPNEDFSRYPRPEREDRELCRRLGVDVLYQPAAERMYPEGFKTHVEVQGLGDVLDGKFRPGHFNGVATVVLKLFNQAAPGRAYFGEKDFQQLVIIRRMARDLDLPVAIVPCPTVRESDGLALSSRNAYLSPEERAWAPKLNEALRDGAAFAAQRKNRGQVSAAVEIMTRRVLEIPGVAVDYLTIVDADTLEPPAAFAGRLRALGAIRIGKTRLIDNIPLICED